MHTCVFNKSATFLFELTHTHARTRARTHTHTHTHKEAKNYNPGCHLICSETSAKEPVISHLNSTHWILYSNWSINNLFYYHKIYGCSQFSTTETKSSQTETQIKLHQKCWWSVNIHYHSKINGQNVLTLHVKRFYHILTRNKPKMHFDSLFCSKTKEQCFSAPF